MFKITEYAESLLEGLNDLDWPESVKDLQRNWIGKSKGCKVKFKIPSNENEITVFTTRPDTLFGATYLVLAPEHPLVNQLTKVENKSSVDEYVIESQKKSDFDRGEVNKNKTGVFTGSYAINPVNNKKIPIWIADYVLMSYGTGSIMAVPAHDDRDYEFASRFNLPIKEVISGGDIKKEAFTLFETLLEKIKIDIIKFLFNMNIVLTEKKDESKSPVDTNQKIGRNEKCPCGSEKKYKHCCGSV